MNVRVNVQQVLKQINIDPRAGKLRAIQDVGERIMADSNPLGFANSVIQKLGGVSQEDFPTARIVCKALVEQACSGDKYDSKAAMQYAIEKVQKLRKDLPFVFAEKGDSDTGSLSAPAKPKKTRDGGDKKLQALEICERNSSLSNGQLAKLIEKEMKISYANAHYYAARVFKRK
jgi:hypothetical protein